MVPLPCDAACAGIPPCRVSRFWRKSRSQMVFSGGKRQRMERSEILAGGNVPVPTREFHPDALPPVESIFETKLSPCDDADRLIRDPSKSLGGSCQGRESDMAAKSQWLLLVTALVGWMGVAGSVAAEDQTFEGYDAPEPMYAAPEAEATLVVYSVADLVVQPARAALPTIAMAVESGPHTASAADSAVTVQHRAVEGMSELSLLLQSVIRPDSWEMQGGPGRVTAHAGTFSLVVRQTPEVHAEIGELLSQLRRLQEASIEVDLEFYVVRQQPDSVSLNDESDPAVESSPIEPAESNAASIASAAVIPEHSDEPDTTLVETLMMGGQVVGAPDELRAAVSSLLTRSGSQRLELQNGWPATAGYLSCIATQSPEDDSLRLHIQTDQAGENPQFGRAMVRLVPGASVLVPLVYENDFMVVLVKTTESVAEVEEAVDAASMETAVMPAAQAYENLGQSTPVQIPERVRPPEPPRSEDRFRDYEVVPTGYIEFTNDTP
jgi:hypothetical protein